MYRRWWAQGKTGCVECDPAARMARRRVESIESGQGQRERVKEEVGFQSLHASNVKTRIEGNSSTHH